MLVKVRCGPFSNYSGLASRARHPALLDDRGGTYTPRGVAGRRGPTLGSDGGSDRFRLGSRNRR